jgi:hypothetical protein
MLHVGIRTGARIIVPVFTVGFASSANYTNHAPLIPSLSAQFHFSQTLAGLLTAGLFLSHAATQVPGGTYRTASVRGSSYPVPWRSCASAISQLSLQTRIGNFSSGRLSSAWGRVQLSSEECVILPPSSRVNGCRSCKGIMADRFYWAQALPFSRYQESWWQSVGAVLSSPRGSSQLPRSFCG